MGFLLLVKHPNQKTSIHDATRRQGITAAIP